MPEFYDLRQISEQGNNAFRQGQAMTAQSQANALDQLKLQNAPQEIARGNRLSELNLRTAEAAPQQAIDEERKKIVMTVGAGMAKKMALAKDDAERAEIYMQGSKGLNQFLTEHNLATPEQRAGVITPLEKLGGPQGFIAVFNNQNTGLTTFERDLEAKTRGFSDEEREEFLRIQAGMLPRAQGSAAITTAVTPGLTEQVAGSESVIAGAKEREKLMADLDLKPSIQANVERAVNNVKMEFELNKEKRSNETAFSVYESAMQQLMSGLGGTETGPLLGFLPALTANQQIADGAVAAMAPILKGIFRTSGEGTFTDKDQEMLIAMLPTRSTRPEARAAQMATVDAIVRSKMGKPIMVESKVLGRKINMRDVFQEAQNEGISVAEVMQELGIQ